MESIHNPEGVKKLSLSLKTMDTDWTDGGNIIISSTGNAPTKGTTTRDKMLWKRVGDSMEIRIEYQQTTAGAAGTGDYLIQLPSGYQIDGNKVRINSTISSFNDYSCVGNGNISDLVSIAECHVEVYDTTHIRVAGVWSTGSASQRGTWGQWFPFSNTNLRVALNFTVPILGWSIQDSYISASSSIASPSDMENLVPGKTVTPNVVGFHPGVAKVWANFHPASPIIIRDSFNISSIIYNSAGNYTINFTQPFASSNYVAFMTSSDDNFRVPLLYFPGTFDTALTPSSCKIRLADFYASGWATHDHSVVCFVAFGR